MQLSAFPFSTILFDLDGTLVDSAPDVLEAIAAVLRDAGDPVPRMELSIIGPPLEGIFREVCPDADEAKIQNGARSARRSSPYKIKKPSFFRSEKGRLFVVTMYDPALFQRASVLEEERDFPCKDMIPGATTGPSASSATDATPPHGTLHVGEARQANTSSRGGRAPRGTDRRTRPGGAYPERRGSQARHTRPAALW